MRKENIQIKYNDKLIEVAIDFDYLGIVFSIAGSHINTVSTRFF